ncbi:YadA-like family protein [Neisseria cinerea]|uniref:YadA-like family protein n=1 Tax=Neisseria cinerea TaxID=483 RepID=UPI0028D6CC0C|nr:YadA-like family protein [Neisseria cinerea]
MNKTFKVIWNHSTQTWTAVSELAGTRKKSKSIKLTAISAALLMACGTAQAATHTAADSLIAISTDSAAGTTAIPAGEQAKATGKDSIAVGKKAAAGKNGNIERATAIGYEANAESNDSLAVGSGASVIVNANNNLNKRSIAIGSQARVEPRPDGGVSSGMHDAIAIGTRAMATAGNSVVIGRDARSKRGLKATFQSGENTVAIGSNASADWGSSIAIGANSRTIVGNGIAIGRDATAMYKIDRLANDGEGRIFTSMALGERATSIGGASIAAGIETKSAGVKSVAVGNKAFANGLQSIAIGDKTYSSDRSSIAMGAYAETGWNGAQRAIAIGRQAHAATTDASAFGSETFSGGVRSTAIGTKANTYGNQTLAVGSSTQNGVGPMAISENAMVFGTDSRSIGNSTIALGNEAIAGVTEADANTIRDAYKTYRSAYNTYRNLDKAVKSADADDYAAKTNLSTEAQNLKLLIDRYNETGTIYQAENNKIKNELATAGITFSDLTTLAGKLTASGEADAINAQPMLENEALINKISDIKKTNTNTYKTEFGEQYEHLGYLVNLADRLKEHIKKAKTAQEALNTAKTAQTAGKAVYDEAKKVFEATYGSGKSKTGAIAIGRSSLAAAEKSVALGDDAEVLRKDSTNAFAAAKNAKVDGTSPNAVVIGADAKAGLAGYSTTIDTVRRYGSADAPNATAVGSSNHVLFEKGSAFGYNNKVRGKSAGAFGVNNIVGENPVWTAKGDDAALISPREGQTGENSFVVGSNNGVWAKNVMVLGNNVRVYGIGRRPENRENAVVLGNNSDGEPTVKKVNSANVNGMVYSGFKGNLGATKTDGSEAEKADLALQGRFVSIGAPTKKIDKTITIADGKTNTTTVTTNLITGEESTTTASANTKDSDVEGTSTETVYGERQIKHVAAGEISSTSTDAINGSQLYAVASGLRDAFPVVYTDSDGNKVVKYPDGQYYPEGTVNINGKYYPAGTTDDNVADATEVTPVTNVIASMNNPVKTDEQDKAHNAGNNLTLTNVAQGANTYEFDKDGNPLVKIGDKYYAQGDVENGAPKEGAQEAEKATDEQKDPYEKAATGLANLDGSKDSNALTVADAKNLGWVVSATGNDYANSVQNAHQVNFVGVGNVDVDGYDQDGVRTLSISVDSPIDYASTKAIVDDAEIDVVKANDGKWYPKDQVDEEGNPKENAKSVPADSIVKKGAVLSDSDAENNPYRNESVYTYQTDDSGNTTVAPKTYADLSKENGYNKDEIKPGTGGVQLNNVGWATNPDQAVNKDQLDQTVNKSGFFVKQNGKTTVENAANKEETDPAKYEKVTPNDVINFVNGNGTVIKAVTKRDAVTGVDTTTVSVDMDTKSLSNDMPVVYTDAAGNKLKKDGGKYYPADAVNIGGKYYPAGTTADNVANATEVAPVTATNIIASMNNPSSDAVNAGGNVTLTNVAPGANTYEFDKDGNPLVNINGKYYAQDDVENGAPKKGAQEAEKATDDQKDPYEKAATGLANLEGSKDSNALTVADAKNLGWVVSADSEDGKGYAAKVTNADEVRFNGKNGIKVTGETDENGIRNINIELEKSDVVKAGEYKIGDKTYVNVDGKLYDKDSIDPKTDKPKADATPSNYTVEDGKVIDNTDAANPKEVAGVDNGSNFVDGNTVYKAIQESGWTVGKVKDALSDGTFKNGDEKVNPNDEVRFADGKGITVKTATVDAINAKGEKQTTTVVKFDTDLPINYANVKNSAGDNLKQANDGNWYKEADVNNDGTVKLDNNGNKPTPETAVKSGATLSDANSNVGKNPYRTAIEDKAMAAAIEKVRGENPTATVEQLLPKVLEEAAKQAAELEKAEKAGQDKDVINPGKDGVQLNNVGWAENPDQAVNKDQLDQTVNKSGFFVQQNGKTTVENAANKEETDPAKSEKVTPNDVVNFVNGNGTVIKAVTKRDANGVDTTTVSVDVDTSKLNVPKGANTITYNAAGDQIVKVDGKYYKLSDLKDGKPTNTATEQTPATPAAGKPLETAKNGLADLAHSDGDNLLTVEDAKNLGWVVSTSGNNTAAPVKNADVVDFKAEAGTGITVEGKSENGKMTVTVGNKYFKANATGEAAKATGPNSVAIGGNSNAAVEDAVAIGNGATVGAEAAKGSVAIGAGAQAGKAHTGAYSLDPSATVAGKPSDATRVVSVGSAGNEAQIQNVAAGVVSETSTDAVNGSQLHATNQSINRLGDTVNNIGGNVTRLSDKVDNMDRDYRAGIAGSNAAASLPQVYLPGKSMVAAAAGTFKGQNALAVGYSSISDNGKLIWKAQANLNSRADVGVGVGMGYLW